jgi:hypothetical protein
MDQILHAAGELLGTTLTDPVDLGGSARSTVLRCWTTGGGSVVVKAYRDDPVALRCFTAEAAGLSLGLAGPKVLGIAPEVPLVVMADLGEAPTLADVLLADDPKAAEEGVLAWARGLGRLAAGSVHRRADLAELSARYSKYGQASWDDDPWIPEGAAQLPGLLESSGIAVPTGLADELDHVGAAVAGAYPAFTPGDTCPDNNLLTPDGLRLIDFEAACFQSVFLTAAYCRLPFATCWCVFTLPSGLAERIEGTFRAEVLAAYPELADDAVWQAGMDRAVVVWTVESTVRMLPRAQQQDVPMHRRRRPVPTMRQVLRHRWLTARAVDAYPAFGAAVRGLLREVADGWDVPPLPTYPAFAG